MASEELKKRFPIGSVVWAAATKPSGNGPGLIGEMDQLWGTKERLTVLGYDGNQEWVQAHHPKIGTWWYDASWVRLPLEHQIRLHPAPADPIPTLKIPKPRTQINLATVEQPKPKSESSLPAVFGAVALAIFGAASAKAGLKKLQETRAEQQVKETK